MSNNYLGPSQNQNSQGQEHTGVNFPGQVIPQEVIIKPDYYPEQIGNYPQAKQPENILEQL